MLSLSISLLRKYSYSVVLFVLFSLSLSRERERERSFLLIFENHNYIVALAHSRTDCLVFCYSRNSMKFQFFFPLSRLSFFVCYCARIKIFSSSCFIVDTKKFLLTIYVAHTLCRRTKLITIMLNYLFLEVKRI